MSLGKRVRMVREEVANKNRTDFAKTIGITADQLNNIERDRINNLSAKRPVFELICSKYGINIEWLIDGEGEMVKKRTENQEFIDFMYNVQKLPNDSITKKFVYGLSKMNIDEMEIVLAKIKELLN